MKLFFDFVFNNEKTYYTFFILFMISSYLFFKKLKMTKIYFITLLITIKIIFHDYLHDKIEAHLEETDVGHHHKISVKLFIGLLFALPILLIPIPEIHH